MAFTHETIATGANLTAETYNDDHDNIVENTIHRGGASLHVLGADTPGNLPSPSILNRHWITYEESGSPSSDAPSWDIDDSASWNPVFGTVAGEVPGDIPSTQEQNDWSGTHDFPEVSVGGKKVVLDEYLTENSNQETLGLGETMAKGRSARVYWVATEDKGVGTSNVTNMEALLGFHALSDFEQQVSSSAPTDGAVVDDNGIVYTGGASSNINYVGRVGVSGPTGSDINGFNYSNLRVKAVAVDSFSNHIYVGGYPVPFNKNTVVLRRLNPFTGQVDWSVTQDVGGEISALDVDDGTDGQGTASAIYVGGLFGWVRRRNALTGGTSVINSWIVHKGDKEITAIRVAGDYVFAGSGEQVEGNQSNAVHKLEKETGEEDESGDWPLLFDGEVKGLSVDSEFIYIASANGVGKYRQDTALRIWEFTTNQDGNIYNAVDVDADGYVYISCLDDDNEAAVMKLTPAGRKVWSKKVPYEVPAHVMVSPGRYGGGFWD